MKPFETTDHTADVGLVVRGATREELFENAARGLVSILGDPETIEPRETREVTARDVDPARLLAAFLTELLYLFEVGRFAVHHADVLALSDTEVRAVAHGEPIAAHHVFDTEIKAVTHHDLHVERVGDGWEAHILFDV